MLVDDDDEVDVLVDVVVLVVVHSPHRKGHSMRIVGPVIEWLHKSSAMPSAAHTSGSFATWLQSIRSPVARVLEISVVVGERFGGTSVVVANFGVDAIREAVVARDTEDVVSATAVVFSVVFAVVAVVAVAAAKKIVEGVRAGVVVSGCCTATIFLTTALFFCAASKL